LFCHDLGLGFSSLETPAFDFLAPINKNPLVTPEAA
jgi:hypothetical protein